MKRDQLADLADKIRPANRQQLLFLVALVAQREQDAISQGQRWSRSAVDWREELYEAIMATAHDETDEALKQTLACVAALACEWAEALTYRKVDL